VDVVAIIEEKIAAATPEPQKPTPPARPRREPAKPKGTGALTDPVLGYARGELSRSSLPTALENYDRLIKKGRFLEEVIHDLREATYLFPVDVNILQSLGDAYMRSNRLQDALDAYTKAEELLR
jgi:tetratricopeptide (TPR) repeat protein